MEKGLRRWELSLILGRLREVWRLCYLEGASVDVVLAKLSEVIDELHRWRSEVKRARRY